MSALIINSLKRCSKRQSFHGNSTRSNVTKIYIKIHRLNLDETQSLLAAEDAPCAAVPRRPLQVDPPPSCIAPTAAPGEMLLLGGRGDCCFQGCKEKKNQLF